MPLEYDTMLSRQWNVSSPVSFHILKGLENVNWRDTALANCHGKISK